MKNFQFIKIRKSHGGHMDVYDDFEKQLMEISGWKFIKSPNKYVQRIFQSLILPKLKQRQFNFNLPHVRSPKYLFALLSGTEYSKIFLQYSFKAKLKVLYMFDPWTILNQLNENALRSYKVNIAFISAKQAVSYFNSINIPGFKAYWIPEAINSSLCKYSNYTEKNIDVIQYGRQWKWLHDKIEPFCNAQKINYSFQTKFEPRNVILDTIAKSKITVCVPRILTHPEQGTLSTLTWRYFECMSSKCLIWGKAPSELVELFGYNPVIEIDMENPEKQLQELIANYSSYIPLIEKNYALVIAKHQWNNRIDDMLEILNKKLLCE